MLDSCYFETCEKKQFFVFFGSFFANMYPELMLVLSELKSRVFRHDCIFFFLFFP